MSEKIILEFKLNGEMTIQDEPGQNAEKRLKFLLDNIGNVERHGHKTGQTHEEHIHINNG